MIQMPILLLFTIVLMTSAQAQKKDKLVVETPDRSKIEVRVPRDLQVKQIGPNHYEIRRNDPALHKIEVKVVPAK
jgi:hypothetical protein